MGHGYDEHEFPSTRWEMRKVKITRAPQAGNTARRRRSGWHHLAQWPRHHKLTLVMTYRGGAEAWWLVQARGSQQAFPGHLCLEDVMAAVLNER